MEREILAVHRGENCPQRIVTCEFCEFPLPAIDLSEHQVQLLSIILKWIALNLVISFGSNFGCDTSVLFFNL